MSKRITPTGNYIIVEPIETQVFKTESGIEAIQNTLSFGKVMEVSRDIAPGLYKEGDEVVFGTGAGIGQYYRERNVLWLNTITEVKGIITNEKAGTDKGDGL